MNNPYIAAYDNLYSQQKPKLPKSQWFILAVVFFLVVMFVVFWAMGARAETINVEKLATAIYYAEHSKSHPYGILAHYNHTTPRQACINTINHALRDWDGKGDFIRFLAGRYAPIGVANDPMGLNRNWIKNVRYYLERR